MQGGLLVYRLWRDTAGLTLPEVLLASVIITVAVLGVVGLFPTALQNIHYGGHMSKASSLAQAMIEMIRTQPFDRISLYDGLDTQDLPQEGLLQSVLDHFEQWKENIVPENPAGALPQGWGTVQVQDEALGLPDLKHLAITVGWQERGPRTITFVTYVARHD